METDKLWRILDGIQSQIRVFDSKAQIAIAVSGVLAGFFGSQTVKIAELVSSQPWSTSSFVLAFVSAVCLCFLATTLAFAIFTVVPRLHLNQPNSRIFFAHICKEFGSDYGKASEALTSMSDAELNQDLASQILTNSIICGKKAHRFKYSLWAMGVAVLLWMVALLFQFRIEESIAGLAASGFSRDGQRWSVWFQHSIQFRYLRSFKEAARAQSVERIRTAR